jgi:hypothetical protein
LLRSSINPQKWADKWPWFGFGSGSSSGDWSAKEVFEFLDELRRADRSAGGFGSAEVGEVILGRFLGETAKVGDPVGHRTDANQCVVRSSEVSAYARPLPLAGGAYQPCAHRIQFGVVEGEADPSLRSG